MKPVHGLKPNAFCLLKRTRLPQSQERKPKALPASKGSSSSRWENPCHCLPLASPIFFAAPSLSLSLPTLYLRFLQFSSISIFISPSLSLSLPDTNALLLLRSSTQAKRARGRCCSSNIQSPSPHLSLSLRHPL